jgi:hypothetical protein
MINFKQIFAPQKPDGSYEDAARQQAIAEALQKRAMQQRGPAPGGPVQAQYGIGEGLTQLAEALLARRAGKSAIEAKKAADTKQTSLNNELAKALTMKSAGSIMDVQTGQSAPMETMTGQRNAYDLQQAVAGIGDPQKAGQFLAGKQMERLLPDPAAVADRELKAYQIEAGMSDRAEARQAQMERLRFEIQAEERAGRRADELKMQLAQLQADARLSAAEIAAGARRDAAEAQGDAKKAAANDKKQGRLASLEAARGALARVQKTSDTLGSGGGYIEGRIPAIGPVAQDFDGAKAQLLAAIQGALRTPGIGSQSNMELQALMAALPERTQEKEVRDNQIKGIADRLAIIIEREANSDAALSPAAPAAAAPAGAPKVGDVVDGYTYKGGDPANPASWSK